MATAMNEVVVWFKGQDKLSKVIKGVRGRIKKLKKNVIEINTNFEEAQKCLSKYGVRFQAFALSVMFFGMMIQRVFSTIAKNTLGTFKKLSNSTISVTVRSSVACQHQVLYG